MAETLEQFMARKSDPNWKPKPLPRYQKKLRKMSDEKFAKLLAEHGGSGIIQVSGQQLEWGLAA